MGGDSIWLTTLAGQREKRCQEREEGERVTFYFFGRRGKKERGKGEGLALRTPFYYEHVHGA